MLDGVKVILVLVVAGMVGGGALDLFVQLLFQLLVVGFGSPDDCSTLDFFGGERVAVRSFSSSNFSFGCCA